MSSKRRGKQNTSLSAATAAGEGLEQPAPKRKKEVLSLGLYYDPTSHLISHETQVLAKENSAQQMTISEGLIATNDKGYRTARAAFGITQGACYFEAIILNDVCCFPPLFPFQSLSTNAHPHRPSPSLTTRTRAKDT